MGIFDEIIDRDAIDMDAINPDFLGDDADEFALAMHIIEEMEKDK